MRKIGYIRVSSESQNLKRQLQQLNEIAKKEGKFKGRVRKYQDHHAGINCVVKLYREGNMTVKKICQITKMSLDSLYKKIEIIQYNQWISQI